MKDLSNKLFFCYAWEDLNEVNTIAADIQHELGASVEVFACEENSDNLEQLAFPKIDDAEVMLVFISEASKGSQFVKDCITHAVQLNKRMLPIDMRKLSLFSSLPPEFKFRVKPLDYSNEEQRARLFGQLKATFAIAVESGDSYGALVHISTDMDAFVKRYGEILCNAKVDQDNAIRLTKGTHELVFTAIDEPGISYSISYTVTSNDGEQFVKVPLSQKLQEVKDAEEKAEREAEARKKFEMENFQKNLELEQKKRELEVQQKQEQVRLMKQEQPKDDNNSGCCTGTVIAYVVGFAIVWFLISLL